MSRSTSEESESSSQAAAYLVVREGGRVGDVFRLNPGQVTTVGRAPTNRIVVRDEICSRNHCEIFRSGADWVLRDLGSRNGTRINGTRVAGDCELQDGQLIEIGGCELGFTYDPSGPFSESVNKKGGVPGDSETAVDVMVLDEPSGEPEQAIIHRTRKTRYRSGAVGMGRGRAGQELAKLYRLGLEMGSARNAAGLAEVVIDGLLSGTCADIGAILLLPPEKNPGSRVQSPEQKAPSERSSTLDSGLSTLDSRPSDLTLVAYKAHSDAPYQKVSDSLSQVVLQEREAVLARSVADDSRLADRDSLGELQAQSVICAPIREGTNLFGLVHLYSTNPDNPLDPDELEFTLAVADQLAVALGSLQEKESLADGLARVQDENLTLRRQLELESELVGDSGPMRTLRETIGRIAPTDATVLIRGESGVGKELVARALHFGSHRSNGPFICLNCAALSETLLESELFGHEKGAFTGATGRKFGKFEQAHQGTLFLDEVGEMGPGMQAKFLRVLEGHPFERVGGGEAIRVDVRVVAATNRNLEEDISEGRFRQDLYFRLHVVEITVEPLRQHRSDVSLLAEYFLKRFVQKIGRPIRRFSREALEVLQSYDWPGNVRELQNAVERAVILCPGDEITAADVPLSNLVPELSPGAGGFNPPARPAEPAERTAGGRAPSGGWSRSTPGTPGAGLPVFDSSHRPPPSAAGRDVSLAALEKEHILATLERTGWNKSQAAQILGIERSTLDRKLKRYDVSRPKS